jgi:hypothetical protein
LASIEIHSIGTTSGNQPRMRRIIEELAQTFLSGVPVQIVAADGGVKEWDGATVAFGIAGFSKEPASNLAATPATPTTFTVGTGSKTLSFGTVPNEASAVNIPRGAPLNDGRVGFEAADNDTIFLGQVGPAQNTVAGDVGKQYGMTKDADGHWFVDKTKTTVGTNTVVQIVKLDPNDISATPRGVYFVVANAAAQITG